MNEPDKKIKKKGKGFAIAAAIFFTAAIWFAFLGVYLYRAMLSYKPPQMQFRKAIWFQFS